MLIWKNWKYLVPDAPQLEDIRLINAENGKGQMCEIEWRPPRRARGHVTRYYVQMSGKLRYVAPEGRVLSADDYPPGVDICSNYNSENSDKYINPNLFQRFFACKYGPLKVVVVENFCLYLSYNITNHTKN